MGARRTCGALPRLARRQAGQPPQRASGSG